MTSVRYRDRAKEHLDMALNYSKCATESANRAACLELRMAIECLVYFWLQHYLKEVPNSAMKKWQPGKVMEELLYADPNSDKTATIRWTQIDTIGLPTTKTRDVGEDTRFSIKWAKKEHSALGSFLHEPTISQNETASESFMTDMQSRVSDVSSFLTSILESKVHFFGIAIRANFKCECGFHIARRAEFLAENKTIACGSCGKIWEYERSDDDKGWNFVPASYSYKCANPDCRKRLHIAKHLFKFDSEYACDKCRDRVVFSECVELRQIT
jgi:hypothetical protein